MKERVSGTLGDGVPRDGQGTATIAWIAKAGNLRIIAIGHELLTQDVEQLLIERKAGPHCVHAFGTGRLDRLGCGQPQLADYLFLTGSQFAVLGQLMGLGCGRPS